MRWCSNNLNLCTFGIFKNFSSSTCQTILEWNFRASSSSVRKLWNFMENFPPPPSIFLAKKEKVKEPRAILLHRPISTRRLDYGWWLEYPQQSAIMVLLILGPWSLHRWMITVYQLWRWVDIKNLQLISAGCMCGWLRTDWLENNTRYTRGWGWIKIRVCSSSKFGK